MKRLIILLLLAGCGTGDDPTTIEDNRTCIVNDSFNISSQPDLEAEAEGSTAGGSNDLEVNQDGQQLAVCGTTVAIDAAITNVDNDTPNLSDFLSTGRKR